MNRPLRARSGKQVSLWRAVLGLAAILWPAAARAGMVVHIDATVGADLETVTGTVEIHADTAFSLEDPLARLPEPPDDLQLTRTYPGQPERGVVRVTPVGTSTWTWYAVLPRRYGDIGAIRRFGLFGNGGWYPQPMTAAGMPVAEWQVDVHLPAGTLGALGGTFGRGDLHWEGRGERASLAVVPRGVATPLPVGKGGAPAVTLITRGPPRHRLVDQLSTHLGLAAVEGTAWKGVIVEAPLRRRLSRGGRDLAYVSDRAFAVTPGMERFHVVGVLRGVVDGLLDLPDPYVRALAAVGVAAHQAKALRGPNARKVLRWTSWIPTFYGILHSRRMPFYSDILENVQPSDPVHDDLVEMFDPHAPATAVMAQVDDRYGPGTAWSLARALLLGLPLERAAAVSGVDPKWLAAWRAPYPKQDYLLTVHKDPPLVRVERKAPPDAPAEAVVIDVDGEKEVRVAGPGPDTVVLLPKERPHHVVVDPAHHTAQISRIGDRWPPRFNLSVDAAITEINFTEGYVYGWAAAWLRHSDNTHDVLTGTLFTNDTTLVGASLRYERLEGPTQDGMSRPHHLWIALNPSLLNGKYADTSGGRYSLGAGIGYGYSSRVATYFPTGGTTVGLDVNAGLLPGTDQHWARADAAWTVIVSPHPRHAFAFHLDAAVAEGTVQHRLLSLGGAGGLRSVGTNEIIGTRRALGLFEYRVAPLRNMDVPLGLVWATELQLSAGLEGGTVVVDGAPKSALGVTLGVMGLGRVFGFEERGIGVTVAWPLKTWGFTSDRAGRPQVYLRWGQAF